MKSTITNIHLIQVSEKSLARKITNQILETFKFPRAIELNPQNYHPDDWAAVNYEEEMRRKGLNLLGNPLAKPHKTLFEEIEEKFLFLSGNLQDIVISIDKVVFRKQEITIVIDESKTIGSAFNSNVVQGDGVSLTISNTIKNYNVVLSNVSKSDIQELENILRKFNSLKEKIQSLNIRDRLKSKVEILKELEKINTEQNLLSKQFEAALSKLTKHYSST